MTFASFVSGQKLKMVYFNLNIFSNLTFVKSVKTKHLFDVFVIL